MTTPDKTDSAGIIVFRKQQDDIEALLIRQGRHHYSFPKGHIEVGESPKEAALRETLEETGITACLLPDFCYPVSSSKPKDRRKVFFFAGRYVSGEPTTQSGETCAVFWLSVKKVPELITFHQDTKAFFAALDFFEHHSPQVGGTTYEIDKNM